MKKTTLLLMLFSLLISTTSVAQLKKSIQKGNRVEINSERNLLNIEPNILEDFESYSDFAISFAPWILNDVDGNVTYGITDHTFPNSGTEMAYIIFNPNATTPSLGEDAALAPHSGSKFAACFNSIPSEGTFNDDWLITPTLTLGTNSQLSFFARSYTVDYGEERLKVLISTTGTNPSDFTEISAGTTFLPAEWTEYVFDLTAYDSQDIHIAFQCISQDAFILMLDDVLVSTEESIEGSTLVGMVSNAVNGEPIEGALVQVAGLSDITDASGNYEINNVPAGSLTANFMATPTNGEAPLNVQFTDLSTSNTQLVTCSASDFITYNNNQVNIPDGGTLTLNISLSPIITGNGMRFVLNWGENPRDLDSHLRTPDIEGSSYHVYYSSQGNATTPPYATLDHDDTQSYGPETITIYDFFSGVYHYYVHHFSGTGDISTSGAVVQIYDENGLLQTLQAPTSGTGIYWYIGTINGATKQITIINTIQSTEPGTGKTNVVYPPKPIIENNQLFEITTWLWNFGDGQTSTLQNPSHIYQNGGTFSVSLTVSDGDNQNILVKENYIYVEGAQGSATLSGMVSNAVDGQPIEGALVEVSGLSDFTDSEGNYTIENVPAGSLTSNFMGYPTQGSNPLTVQFTDLSTNNTQLVTCSATDFSTYNNNQVIIPDGSNVTLNISLSPIISGSGMRFVLNWGENPSDLDSHLRTPDIEGSSYHVYYSSQGNATTPPYATLDHDDTQSYGPETVTIYNFFTGTYHYYVHHFSGSGNISTSGAVVQIYNEGGLIQTLQAPTSGEGIYWYLGTIDGNTQIMNLINVIQDTEPGTGKSNVIYPPKPVIETNIKYEVSSWDWSFGDGGTSTLQSPSHTFTSDGMFTVSLVISDGLDTRTETKVGYIRVGNAYSIDEIIANNISLFPNPANDFIEFNSEYVIKQIKLFNYEGKLFIEKNVGSETTKLSLSGLPKGVYLVQISINNSIITKKLIIQ